MIQNKISLKSFFKTGFKPTEQNFADLIDSYINFEDDFDGGDLALSQGIKLSDSTNNEAGTIRFNTGTNQFEGHNGTSFGPLGGGGSSPWSESGGDITYAAGNVGIGTGGAPGFLLDVAPDANQHVRFAKSAIGGHPSGDSAIFSHHDKTDPDEIAISHDGLGNLILNSSEGSSVIVFSQKGNPAMYLGNGKLGIGGFPGASQELQVFGNASKQDGGSTWDAWTSDERLKKNIKGLKIGLKELNKLRPVTFEYNGKMNMPKNKVQIGLIAQEVEKVVPEMVKKVKTKLNDSDKKETELLTLNIDPMFYIMVNAIKELDKKVEELKSKLKGK